MQIAHLSNQPIAHLYTDEQGWSMASLSLRSCGGVTARCAADPNVRRPLTLPPAAPPTRRPPLAVAADGKGRRC